jgi:hypothetical protein
VVETGRDQADVVAASFAASGLSPTVESDDEIGGTVVLGRRISGDRPGSGRISR